MEGKMLTFAQPLWLLAGLIGCLGLALFFRYLEKERRAALERFVAHQLVGRLTGNISTGRRGAKNLLILLAVLLTFAALARPQYGERWVDVKRRGIDLLFALDTSKSMLAEDVKPNRLKRAHLAILDFVRKLDGDRIGLLPFAGTAYLMCPLTLDYDAFEQSLSAVNTELIPKGGTNLAGVIDRAVEVLDNTANTKILIIVTDGENLEGDAVQAAEKAAAKGLTIHTVGVGSEKGELVPLGGSGGFVKDEAGNFVTSRLDDKTLKAIADKSGGLYAPLGSGEGLEAIYRQKLALIPKEELAERRHKVPIERFEWPLALAAVVLVAEMLLGERKRLRPRPLAETFRRLLSKKAKLLVLLLLLVPFCARTSYAGQGEEAYRRGDYLAASEYYGKLLEKSPNDAQLQYNFGTAAYRNNMYDNAIEAFTKALRTDDIALQQKAYYNRGNSQYKKGAEMRQADPRAAAEQWRQAVASLQSALELNPADQDARHNKELVSSQLAQLEEELKQQKPDQRQDDQRQDQQRQDSQHKDGGRKKDGTQQDQQQGQSPATPQQDGSLSDKTGRQAGAQQAAPEDRQKKTGSGDEHKQDSAGEAGQKAAADRTDGQQARAAQAVRDAERRQQGKMTKGEAEQLLNALKQEEGELNFVPSARTTDKTARDW